MRYPGFIVASVLMVAALATTMPAQAQTPAAPITVTIGPWEGPRCFSKISPELKLTGVPPGAAQARVFLTDLFVPTFDHGGGRIGLTVSAAGDAVIPSGAVPNYKGPCPEQDRFNPIHDYEFSVVIQNASGDTIARGKGTALFDPSNEQGRFAGKRK
jgi:hypothetical protein